MHKDRIKLEHPHIGIPGFVSHILFTHMYIHDKYGWHVCFLHLRNFSTISARITYLYPAILATPLIAYVGYYVRFIATERKKWFVLSFPDNLFTFLIYACLFYYSAGYTVAIGTAFSETGSRTIDQIFSFRSNSDNLIVLESNILDRETIGRYVFSVVATDDTSQTSTANVTIILTDINDEIPMITNAG